MDYAIVISGFLGLGLIGVGAIVGVGGVETSLGYGLLGILLEIIGISLLMLNQWLLEIDKERGTKHETK
ncbi:MAG: hypothetical protein PT939_05085 [Aerococcus suis]|nr:hypothetical protein [Aerococcus suis]